MIFCVRPTRQMFVQTAHEPGYIGQAFMPQFNDYHGHSLLTRALAELLLIARHDHRQVKIMLPALHDFLVGSVSRLCGFQAQHELEFRHNG